jgi:cytoskeletal protein CcmA (bactofilin family)
MWNKPKDEPVRPAGAPPAATPPTAAPFTPSSAPSSGDRREAAGVGASISIVGDVTGDEDLTILGRVEGKVDLPQHVVTVGQSGRVKADIRARVISVAGEVHGNLVAAEQILIRRTATMLGNLTAPRVGLEDGCSFRGSVEMESPPDRGRSSGASSARGTGGGSPAKTSPAPTTAAGTPGEASAAVKSETPPTRP